jgi:L-serine deaminase
MEPVAELVAQVGVHRTALVVALLMISPRNEVQQEFADVFDPVWTLVLDAVKDCADDGVGETVGLWRVQELAIVAFGTIVGNEREDLEERVDSVRLSLLRVFEEFRDERCEVRCREREPGDLALFGGRACRSRSW